MSESNIVSEQVRLYEFDVRVVDIDEEGYYYPRWDLATPMTITAPTRQNAIKQASDLMGKCRRGRYWGVKVVGVRSASVRGGDVTPPKS